MACALFFSTQPDCHKPQVHVALNDTATGRWQGLIAEAARQFSIPDAWIIRVMAAESGGHLTLNGKPITSPKGAMGLMQLMPDTWQAMRRQYGLGNDPYDPHDNIFAGAAFLRELQDAFGTEGVFAAYNVGPGRYRAYLTGLRPLPAETKAYVARLASGAANAISTVPPTSLFVTISTTKTTSTGAQSAAIGSTNAHDLFVPLSRPVP